MRLFLSIEELRETPDLIAWWDINISHLTLEELREFKDYIELPDKYGFTQKINFFNILRYNENVDFNFVREFIPKFKGKHFQEALGILESKFFKPKYIRELLRLWVDWNVKHKTKGLY